MDKVTEAAADIRNKLSPIKNMLSIITRHVLANLPNSINGVVRHEVKKANECLQQIESKLSELEGAQSNEQKWIRVEDGLPDEGIIVIVYNLRTLRSESCYYDNGHKESFIKSFSHWQYMPQPPSKPE